MIAAGCFVVFCAVMAVARATSQDSLLGQLIGAALAAVGVWLTHAR